MNIKINVFADDSGVFEPILSKSQNQRKQRQEKLKVPLFVSFFSHDKNTIDQHAYAQYTKENSKWQGHVLEEKTGNADADDVFAQVAVNFGDEFLDFFVDNNHEQLLSVLSTFPCLMSNLQGSLQRSLEI